MFATLILLLLSAVVAFGEENVACFDNFECSHNPDYCTGATCSITPHNDKQKEQFATVTCELSKTLDDLKFRVVVFAKELNGNLLDVEEDFCGFMSGKVPGKILAILMPFIKKYSNIDHPCPYTGKIDLKALPLGSHLLASHHIPSGDYLLNTYVVSNAVYLLNVTTSLHIPEGKSVKAAVK